MRLPQQILCISNGQNPSRGLREIVMPVPDRWILCQSVWWISANKEQLLSPGNGNDMPGLSNSYKIRHLLPRMTALHDRFLKTYARKT